MVTRERRAASQPSASRFGRDERHAPPAKRRLSGNGRCPLVTNQTEIRTSFRVFGALFSMRAGVAAATAAPMRAVRSVGPAFSAPVASWPPHSRANAAVSIQACADHVPMIQGAVSLAQAWRGANRFYDIVFGAFDGGAQGEPVGDTAGDGGGEREAGAVRRARDDARVLEVCAFAVCSAQQVDDRVAG